MQKNIIKNKKQQKASFVFFAVFVFILVNIFSNFNFAFATINKEINYQGKLTDSSGVAVTNGTYNMEFKLYTSGGATLWTEARTGGNRVTVSSGLFSVMLGEVASLTGVDFNQTLYLGVNIGGLDVSPTWDGEMTPRKKLGVVPAAIEAENAIKSTNLAGGNSTTLLGSIPYQSDTDTTTLLAPNTTTTKKFFSMLGTGTNGAIPNWDTLIATDVGLGNVTNESKTTMFTSPTFTGSVGGFTMGGDIVFGANTFTTSNTNVVTNLNADLLDGQHASAFQTVLTNPVIGTGTLNYLPKFTATGSTIGNSLIYDDGTNVGIGTTSPGKKLDVVGGAIRTDDQLISTVITGTAPLAVTSTTLVTNLNADLVDGHHSSDFQTTLTNPVTGLGTANYLSKFTITGSELGNSSIFDNGTSVGIGTASSLIGKLDVRVPNSASDVAIASFGMPDYGHLEIHQVVSSGYAAPTGSLFKYVDEFGNPYDSLFMDRLGNVGIGMTSPAYKLDVNGTIYTNTSVISPYVVGGVLTTSDLYFKTTTAGGVSGADMHFLVGNNGATEAMTILNDGKVGINNPAPTEALDVNGNIKTTGTLNFSTAGFTFEQVASPASVTVKKGSDEIMVFDEL